MDFAALIHGFRDCPCGRKHECAVKDIEIGSGITREMGDILRKNGFPRKLLLVADKTTLRVSEGIFDALSGFDLTTLIYDELRVATMDEVRCVEGYLDAGCEGVIAVGTGSIHDPCRLACANKGKPLCLFATAPSMDGFASYSAPIVDNHFKTTFPAKCPEVIAADTKILAAAPARLKSAGFGDMVAKYIALVDWRVSHLISGEYYCEKVADLTRYAADYVMGMADRVTATDEESARAIFEGLLLTGIAMSFTGTSRPGSGSEHVMSHFLECRELMEGIVPDFHGEDVGVMTLIILRAYRQFLDVTELRTHKEATDWDDVARAYGGMAEEMKKLNTPTNITDEVDPALLATHLDEIKDIVRSVPSADEVEDAMRRAGCRTTYREIGKERALIEESYRYHPYMRRRLSLRRLFQLTDFEPKNIF